MSFSVSLKLTWWRKVIVLYIVGSVLRLNIFFLFCNSTLALYNLYKISPIYKCLLYFNKKKAHKRCVFVFILSHNCDSFVWNFSMLTILFIKRYTISSSLIPSTQRWYRWWLYRYLFVFVCLLLMHYDLINHLILLDRLVDEENSILKVY